MASSSPITTTTTLHPFNSYFFQDNLSKPPPKRQTVLDFNKARDNGVAVASAGHLHLAADGYHASTSPFSFYRPDALSVTQPTASKHWSNYW